MEQRLKLFYSYSHKDAEHRDSMEEALAMLRRNGLLKEWHDRNIAAGEKISEKIFAALQDADIIVFLLSPSFLSSDACIEEWEHAKELARTHTKILISIIVRECAWEDFDDARAFKALPNDGKPVATAANRDKAWKEVYLGIKESIEKFQKTFTPKQDAIKELNSIEFYSQARDMITLDDLFIFPELINETDEIDEKRKNIRVKGVNELVGLGKCIIRGEELSGKSKLGVHILNQLISENKPVLLVDLESIKSRKPDLRIFEDIYQKYFNGDFKVWLKQNDTTIIFDNLTSHGNCLSYVDIGINNFSNVLVLTSNDNYASYFRDEPRLAKFTTIKIGTFTHQKQEQLIRKWIGLRNAGEESEPDYNLIDKVEREVNGIIISDKVIPRYPFYILSILQTYEAFMPQDMKITAYGHCYYALILANLIKSGIDKRDESIDACFTFLSKLAFAIYLGDIDSSSISEEKYEEFLADYTEKHILSNALQSRMLGTQSILKRNSEGGVKFSFLYTYYFFLGRYIAINYKDNEQLVGRMLEKSHLDTNSLSLIFAIHHAQGIEIIDDILTHTFCLIDSVKPARLDKTETALFNEFLSEVPDRILSEKSIDHERQQERMYRDSEEDSLAKEQNTIINANDQDDEANSTDLNNFYRAIKNMEILSQILKNKYGSLEKRKVQEIIEVIADTGLRMISFFLGNEEAVKSLMIYIERRIENDPASKKHISTVEKKVNIRKLSSTLLFLYSIGIIEKIVAALSKPEIGDILKLTAETKNTPAYDIIAYFYALDNSSKFNDSVKNELDVLLDRYRSKDMFFTRRVVSLRTQFYMNTHTISAPMKQALSSSLKIEYKP